MSSLENLSTSARQEPQGEETTDLPPGLLDAGRVSASSSSLSSVCGDDVDDKSSAWQTGTSVNDAWVATTTGQQWSQQQQQLAQSSSTLSQTLDVVDYRPVVSIGAANSFIRQLLHNSPQYSHLLADLQPVPVGGGGSPSAAESPKSALRGGGRTDGRSLPEAPTTSSVSSPRPGLLTYAGSQSEAVNRRLVNRYVNVDDDGGRSTPHRPYRDKPRPSTAPSGEHPPASTATPVPVARVQTLADPVERHRSFEVIDRVTGATLPRASAASGAKPSSSSKRISPPQSEHPDSRHLQSQRTSPQHLQRSSPAQQQQQQQQRVNGSPQSQPEHHSTPTTASSSSLCVEQQCSSGDNQRSSPQTVWYVPAIVTLTASSESVM